MWFRVEDRKMDGLVEMKLVDNLWEELRVEAQGDGLYGKPYMGVSHHGHQFADPLSRGDSHQEEDLHS